MSNPKTMTMIALERRDTDDGFVCKVSALEGPMNTFDPPSEVVLYEGGDAQAASEATTDKIDEACAARNVVIVIGVGGEIKAVAAEGLLHTDDGNTYDRLDGRGEVTDDDLDALNKMMSVAAVYEQFFKAYGGDVRQMLDAALTQAGETLADEAEEFLKGRGGYL